MKSTFLQLTMGLLLMASALPVVAEPTRNSNICGSFSLIQTPNVQYSYPNLPATVTWDLKSFGGSGGIIGIPPCSKPNGAQNITVNWGDGSAVQSIPNFVGELTPLSHTFTTPGSVDVTVTGQSTFPTGDLVDFTLTYQLFFGPSGQPQVTSIQRVDSLSTTGMDWNVRLYDNRTKILFLTDELGRDEIREADLGTDGTVSAARAFPLSFQAGTAIYAFEVTADGSKILALIGVGGRAPSFVLIDRVANPSQLRSVQVPTFAKGARTTDETTNSAPLWEHSRSIALSGDGSRLLVNASLTRGGVWNILSCAPAADNPFRYEVQSDYVWPDEFERLTALGGTLRLYAGKDDTLYSTNEAGPLPGPYFANIPFDDLIEYESPVFNSWIGTSDLELGAVNAQGTFFLFSSNKQPSEGEYDIYIGSLAPFPAAPEAIVGSIAPNPAFDRNSDGVIDSADLVTP